MNKIYEILGNLQIFIQYLLWTLSFYWIDFELFTYILNNYPYIKILTGIIILACQLFLFQFLYYLIKVDSIFEKDDDNELQNISEKTDFTSCKKCNILRPKRAHHCRACNKCILEMDHHCFSLNKCIGKENYNFFIKYIIMIELNSCYAFWIALYVCINYYSVIKLAGLIKYGILIFVSFMSSCGLFFYLMFHIYLYLADLTTVEFLYPNLRVDGNKITKN
jgi:ribosomal protein L40E